jgi:hypothetical protein
MTQLVVFHEPRHQSGVRYSVGSYTTATQGVEERHCTIDVPAGAKGAQDDIVGLEVGGEAAPEGAVGKGGEECVRFGEPAGADKRVEEGVVGADAGVATEEGREVAERGERRVGHERAREGREDDERRGFGEERAVAHAREEAEESREERRGGGGEAAEEVEEERLRRGEGRAGGDEELEVGERGGGVRVGLDELHQAVDGRRLGIGPRRRHRAVGSRGRRFARAIVSLWEGFRFAVVIRILAVQ